MLEIIILAAGKGTRMRSDKPKVLHTLAGKPFLEHVLDRSAELNADKVHVIIGHGADMVREALAGRDVNFVEQTEQLGTGHAVLQVLPHLNPESDTLILYGDVPLTKTDTLAELRAKVSDSSMGLLTVNLADPNGYGRIVRTNGSVTAIVEQKDANPEQLKIDEVNTGVMAVKSAHLAKWLPALSNDNAQGEYYLTDIIAMSSADDIAIETAQPKDEYEVLGVNNRLQQAELERIFQRQVAEELMVAGATLLDPARLDCRGSIEVGRDCVIDVNCVFEGKVVLGNNVHIGPNCVISDSTIGDGTVILANSILEESTLAENCNIGPFARLRPGSQLASKAKIGNFVETKKAVIGEGSKVNHLSYVGDAEIGAGVNIGAGTITCNYDGVNKSKTTIEDGAFIGSNSALVAPVTVGKNATVGAGSIVTKNSEEGDLIIARAKQSNIKGWARPVKK
ncbi:bifunctional UDP-N-acetylglucosamine diphosphorylase/glucosamine-1-phosphate N-acetyltransferase GlmU [Saccharophagus degradans]|uniref:Bifunctional protein GlmU n=1 Tax=Saccharophagus degradans (strain 2-40 / ATCC 43961 / DSM 17024) TaxID=203122 RepID=GLMU_SACD2|nr:bifunctional UDP-N-acetylglucosamine diphosphorylase/glucosamine-1-phosphate N-acetyltransferase GlmU [Saccharophagus degradans]Q21DL5.1 RecName: Full=Bifunctional protein GlmU; Includes: RecName: Full=UDP-N-acetylglucosamine pyrophosphorylase; AltName: Full=N-acetylglucosamine-1-phosphate uridyltransferase; Includes: RecName: Full=Glucosamine-1-phosphate N-acetyltransferase [Saccharophagus degradans 2-40]ABD83214.1 UDP-N-acetylglucosamine pyrophosphorylase / glucosamine-1-phosphate N-acetyltr